MEKREQDILKKIEEKTEEIKVPDSLMPEQTEDKKDLPLREPCGGLRRPCGRDFSGGAVWRRNAGGYGCCRGESGRRTRYGRDRRKYGYL